MPRGGKIVGMKVGPVEFDRTGIEFLQSLSATSSPVSFSSLVDESGHLIDFKCEELSVEEVAQRLSLERLVRRLLKQVIPEERDRLILKMLFGVGSEECTQIEISRRLRISRKAVRSSIDRSFEKLRQHCLLSGITPDDI